MLNIYAISSRHIRYMFFRWVGGGILTSNTFFFSFYVFFLVGVVVDLSLKFKPRIAILGCLVVKKNGDSIQV